ncbi:maleylacetate reductase [Nocardia sp. GAS34]|uniref:maleylacetate reductase n=1 Tax=unclassified Nocardia TaxID=2637762 RepID=UPI003D1F55AE
MTEGFTYQAAPMRVVFGAGSIDRLRAEAEQLGLRRALVLSTPSQDALAQRAAEQLGDLAAGVFGQARMHVPVETAHAAAAAAKAAAADGCVAIGGGSTIGLGKAVALDLGLPVIAVPTTYSGSEMTPIWGLTEAGRKRTGRDPIVLPRSVIYDPQLSAGLPLAISGTSALNAMAHAMEALYAPDASPIPSVMAEQGVRALAAAIPALVADSADPMARADALQGAWLCGACLGATTMGLHHKLAHVLGGTFDLPHAQTHAVLLPYVAAFTLPRAPRACEILRRALNTDSPARAFAHLGELSGAPGSLAALGLRETDLDDVVEQVIGAAYSAHIPVTPRELRDLLARAWRGLRVE